MALGKVNIALLAVIGLGSAAWIGQSSVASIKMMPARFQTNVPANDLNITDKLRREGDSDSHPVETEVCFSKPFRIFNASEKPISLGIGVYATDDVSSLPTLKPMQAYTLNLQYAGRFTILDQNNYKPMMIYTAKNC